MNGGGGSRHTGWTDKEIGFLFCKNIPETNDLLKLTSEIKKKDDF